MQQRRLQRRLSGGRRGGSRTGGMVAGRYDVGGDVTLRTTLEGALPSEGELRERERGKRYFFVGERGLEEGSERSGIDLAMMM